VIFQSTFARHAGWDEDQVGTLIEPQGMGGNHVGDNGHERRAVLPESFQQERGCQRVDADQQVGGMLFHQPARCAPDDGPESGCHQAGLRAPIADLVAHAPQFRQFDHFRVEARQSVVGWRGVVFEEIHHFGGDSMAEFKLQGFDDGLHGSTVPSSSVGEKKEDVGLFRRDGRLPILAKIIRQVCHRFPSEASPSAAAPVHAG
jgi:hypothetical protein